MSSANIRVSGWLRKSPPEKKLRRNAWRKRWFVLRSGRLSGDPNLLQYYKHEGSKKPLGAIVLDECSQIDANVPVKYERKDPSQQYVFDIVTKTRTYYLVAEDSREMSFWVRCLCDLCGFNHENSDQSSDLGSEQQTFRPNRNRTSLRENGVSPLLQNQQEPPLADAPTPLPRPSQTLTKQSILIRDRGTNDQSSGHESAAASSQGPPTGQSIPGFSRVPDSLLPNSDESYVFAGEAGPEQTDPSPPDGVEYLHLKDFTTAHTIDDKPKTPAFLSTMNSLGGRRPSTDSVFTHEAGVNEPPSEPTPDPSLPSTQLRYPLRKTRLDSMPDCPPPPPPIKGLNRPQIHMIDERGVPLPRDDACFDDVRESRKTSAQSPGLSPIDDSELIRVPLSLQQQFGVDGIGRKLPGGDARGRGGAHTTISSGYATAEYINTADATAEAQFGSATSHRFDSHKQSLTSTPFSSGNKSASSMLTDSSVFFNSPVPPDSARHPMYDSPSPLTSLYASPRNAPPYQSSLSNKGPLYSSTNALSPYMVRGAPVPGYSAQNSPLHAPRIRRSSSVGQLEKVANDMAAESGGHIVPNRRSSIDHRYNRPKPLLGMLPQYGASITVDTSQNKSSVPPPRPPKSEHTAQASQKNHPHPQPPPPLFQSSDYLNLSDCQEAFSSKHEAPSSPPHTEVMTVWSPPSDESAPPQASTRPTPVEERTTDKKPGAVMSGGIRSSTSSRGVRSSTSSGGSSTSSTGSSSGRSSTAAVFDVGSVSTREASVASMYDVPRKGEIGLEPGKGLYDAPKPGINVSPLYDSPMKSAPTLPHIDEARPSYEVMTNHSEPLPPTFDQFSAYTCMAGTPALNSPSLSKTSMSPNITRSSASSEAPPINRDLKPGRRSLGSDGGVAESSKYSYPRSAYDDRFDAPAPPLDPPVSPPHVAIMHTVSSPVNTSGTSLDTSASPRLHDRVTPPDRPPKNPGYSRSNAPNAPHAPSRHQAHGFDKPRYGQESVVLAKVATPAVPGRPPKPVCMQPSTRGEERSQSMRLNRADLAWGSKPTRAAQTPDFISYVHPNSVSGVVPPPPSEPSEKPLMYVELAELPKSQESQPAVSGGVFPPDRVTVGEGGVEYWVLDSEKTEALQKMKEEREKEKRSGSSDAKSIKSGRF